MGESRNMAAVRAASQAFTDGDLDRFVGSLASSFVSQQSEAVPWRGVYHGREGVVVVGYARITPRSAGEATTTVRELHIWHVENGHLLGLEVFLNAPAPLLAALGS